MKDQSRKKRDGEIVIARKLWLASRLTKQSQKRDCFVGQRKKGILLAMTGAHSAERNYKAKVFVVSAPSGCGKTTLCDRLLGDGLGLRNSISMTTRRPRPGERRNADYRFVSRRRFLELAKKKAFLEYEENFGNLYGTPARFVEANLAKGRSVLLSIDVKGAMKIRRVYPKDSVLIFILPPSIKELKARLKRRASDSPEDVDRRLSLAKKEISYSRRYDYRIINDKLDKAYKALKGIVVSQPEDLRNA